MKPEFNEEKFYDQDFRKKMLELIEKNYREISNAIEEKTTAR